MGAEIFQIQIGDNVKSIDSFSLNGSDLTLTFTTKKGGSQTLTQSLFTFQEAEIKDNVENYSELLTIVNPANNQFAYVRNSQGTAWLPGSVGGNYYGSGLYMWNGIEWIEDDTDVFNQLEILINNLNLEIQERDIADNLLQSQINLKLDDVIEGNNISIDKTDPNNPIIISLSDRYRTTSTTENTIANNGTLTFQVDTDLAYIPNQDVLMDANGTNYMNGHVESYDPITGVLVAHISHKTGSGTFSSWDIGLDGVKAEPYVPSDWGYYATNIQYTELTGTIPTGQVLIGNIDSTTVYRFISTAQTGLYPTEDSFYSTFDGTTLSDLITTR